MMYNVSQAMDAASCMIILHKGPRKFNGHPLTVNCDYETARMTRIPDLMMLTEINAEIQTKEIFNGLGEIPLLP